MCARHITVFSSNVIPLFLSHKCLTGHFPHFLPLHSFDPIVQIGSSSFHGGTSSFFAAFLQVSSIKRAHALAEPFQKSFYVFPQNLVVIAALQDCVSFSVALFFSVFLCHLTYFPVIFSFQDSSPVVHVSIKPSR